jgi:hypothetical protein
MGGGRVYFAQNSKLFLSKRSVGERGLIFAWRWLQR